jgi:hypothetical protein
MKAHNMISSKYAASSLILTIILSLTALSIIFLLVFHSYVSQILVEKTLIQERLNTNIYSALEFLKIKNKDMPYDNQNILDLYSDAKDSVSFSKKFWGMYDILEIKSYTGSHISCETFLTGSRHQGNKMALLIYGNEYSALTFCKSARIKGDVYLKDGIVEKSVIDGVPYLYESPIIGELLKDAQKLKNKLGINESYLTQLNHWQMGEFDKVYEINQIEDSVSRNFDELTLYYNSLNTLKLTQKLSGNIIIRSSKTIEIFPESKLADIILIAPKIIVHAKVRGNFQMIANDTILVESNVNLNYPSVGLIINNEDGLVSISENVNFNGDIIMIDSEHKQFCQIEKTSKILGNIYLNGILDLKGDIYGWVYCKGLLYKTSTTLYQNYLIDTKIMNINEDYINGNIFDYEHSTMHVIKCFKKSD